MPKNQRRCNHFVKIYLSKTKWRRCKNISVKNGLCHIHSKGSSDINHRCFCGELCFGQSCERCARWRSAGFVVWTSMDGTVIYESASLDM